jgi:hypothetical protein
MDCDVAESRADRRAEVRRKIDLNTNRLKDQKNFALRVFPNLFHLSAECRV